MEQLEAKPGRKVCEAMRGLVEEGQHEIEEHDEKGPILDLVIVAGMPRTSTMKSPPTARMWLWRKPSARKRWPPFSPRRSRKRSRPLKLMEVTEQHIMPAALGSDQTTEKEPSDRRPGGRLHLLDEGAFIQAIETARTGRHEASSARCTQQNRRHRLDQFGLPFEAPWAGMPRVTRGRCRCRSQGPGQAGSVRHICPSHSTPKLFSSMLQRGGGQVRCVMSTSHTSASGRPQE
jgi:hypothetical protein